MAALILLDTSHALQRRENVRVDLLHARCSALGKRVVNEVSALLLTAVSLLFIWLSLGRVESRTRSARPRPTRAVSGRAGW